MTNLNSNLHVVARVFLGLLFLVAGLGKLGNVDGFAGYMASGGILCCDSGALSLCPCRSDADDAIL